MQSFSFSDLQTEVKNVLDFCEELLIDRNVELTIVMDEHLNKDGRLYLDWSRFRQVISHLVSNAAHFSHPGSSINIVCSVRQRPI